MSFSAGATTLIATAKESDTDDDAPYEAVLEAVQVAHAVAASALGFSSHLSSLLIRDQGTPWSKIPWCETVAGLQHLQEVCIAESASRAPEPQAPQIPANTAQFDIQG